jgi:hypothetical protein
MAETGAKLSKTFHGTHFAESIEGWNLRVEEQQAKETTFWDLAESRIAEVYPDESDEDDMTRDVVISALDGASSAQEYRDSYGGWAELRLDEEINERGARLENFSTNRSLLLADLGTSIGDSFERYALERYLPRDEPTPVTELLARIATTKLDLINFDNFTQANAGSLFQRIGATAFHAGTFTDIGIYVKNNRVIVPAVKGSVWFARYEHPRRKMQILHAVPLYSIDPRELDGGFDVQDPSQLLRMSSFWKSFGSRRSVWSVGAVPEGTLVYDEDKESEHYVDNVDFF